jgi:uncharacterized Tic20 family protein
MEPNRPNQDERTMAALAHASIIAFGMGIIASVVLWATQKDRSRYVALQALQATVYHIIGFCIFMAGMLCWLILYFASFIPLMIAVEQGSNDPPVAFILSMLLMVVPLIFMGIWIICGLWGAVRAFQGRDFRYPVIGDQVERWLAEG